MPKLNVTITRFVDAAQPGWVECTFNDVHGKTWTLKEKVPVVTAAPLDARSAYPQPGQVACQVVISWLDATGREVVTIDTASPWGVHATTGESTFDVMAAQLQK